MRKTESELALSVMVSGRCPCETANHHQCDREQVMSDFDLVVRGRLVDARRVVDDGWLAIRDGCFVARGEGMPPAARATLDARGQWVLPGVVDGQVHAGSQANQEGLGHASRAAAAGGITVMVDMPYDDPEPVASRAQLDAKIAKVERDCHVDVALSGTLNDMYGLEAVSGLMRVVSAHSSFRRSKPVQGAFRGSKKTCYTRRSDGSRHQGSRAPCTTRCRI
jgi:hypothetical protein